MLKKLAAGLALASLATCARRRLARRRPPRPRTRPTLAASRRTRSRRQPSGNLKPAQKLPITQVVLFNSGVGYFHRSGDVEGEARVDLQFSAADINDLIKSLVVHDAHGQTVPLRYDSQEPIEKTLKSFAIDLSTNPSYGQILNQMRGQKVELTLQTNNPALNGLPGTLTGTIVGMETAHRPPSPTAPGVAEMELLNLACAEGLRSVPLVGRPAGPVPEPGRRERAAAGPRSRRRRARQPRRRRSTSASRARASARSEVGYVVENPIWKTSYRLVKGENGKWRLQAWANVENTSDDDWNDIKLTLVSSRPISFQMDLYPPLFIPRPTVEPALFASLRPPTYGGPITNAAINVPGFGLQGGAGFGGGLGGTSDPAASAATGTRWSSGQRRRPAGRNLAAQFGQQGGQFGFQGGQAGDQLVQPLPEQHGVLRQHTAG